MLNLWKQKSVIREVSSRKGGEKMKRLAVIGIDVVAIALVFYILSGIKDILNTEIINRIAMLQMSNTPESSVAIQTYMFYNDCGNRLIALVFFIIVTIVVGISIKKMNIEKEF